MIAMPWSSWITNMTASPTMNSTSRAVLQGIAIIAHPDNPGAVNTIAILVIVCFLIGIARSWELIGGPSFGIRHEVTALVRRHEGEPADEGEPS